MQPRSLACLAALALFGAACSGGGGTGAARPAPQPTPQLDPGVDLSGVWSIRLTVTSVTGPCVGLFRGIVPGAELPGVSQLAHDPASGRLQFDVDDPAETITGTLNGATFSHVETETDPSGNVSTFTLNLNFSADGRSVSGTARDRMVDAAGALLCELVFQVSGEPTAGSLQFLLEWDTDEDVDLEARDSGGTNIYWGFQQGGASGGRHSGDANRQCTDNLIGIEAITFATPQPGLFTARVYISLTTGCVGLNPIGFTLTTVEPGAAVPTVVHDFMSRQNPYTHQVTVQ